jgi:DNA polymerase-3 subunit delta'
VSTPPTLEEVPWLAPQAQQLRHARSAGRFPSGLLIHDERGAGGEILARFAAQLALCRQPSAPCGHCRDCRAFLSAVHPDFFQVSPVEDSRIIRVDQVRDLCEQLALTAHAGGATVALLLPADTMNANAANALLKTLEEPRAGVTLILLCTTPSRLPATLRSRCLRLQVRPPERAESVAWLEGRCGPGPWQAVLAVIGEAPLEALALDAEEVARLKAETDRALADLASGRLEVAVTAERWARADSFSLRLACLETWITSRIDGAAAARRQSSKLGTGAQRPGAHSDINIAALLRVLDGVYELRRLRLTPINRSLALEQLLWQLWRAHRRAAAPVFD